MDVLKNRQVLQYLVSVRSWKRFFIIVFPEWFLSHLVELFLCLFPLFFSFSSLALLTHILEVFEFLWHNGSCIALNVARFVTFLISCDSMFHIYGPSAKKSWFPILHKHQCCSFKMLLLLMIAFALLETQTLKNHEVRLQITWLFFVFKWIDFWSVFFSSCFLFF